MKFQVRVRRLAMLENIVYHLHETCIRRCFDWFHLSCITWRKQKTSIDGVSRRTNTNVWKQWKCSLEDVCISTNIMEENRRRHGTWFLSDPLWGSLTCTLCKTTWKRKDEGFTYRMTKMKTLRFSLNVLRKPLKMKTSQQFWTLTFRSCGILPFLCTERFIYVFLHLYRRHDHLPYKSISRYAIWEWISLRYQHQRTSRVT